MTNTALKNLSVPVLYVPHVPVQILSVIVVYMQYIVQYIRVLWYVLTELLCTVRSIPYSTQYVRTYVPVIELVRTVTYRYSTVLVLVYLYCTCTRR